MPSSPPPLGRRRRLLSSQAMYIGLFPAFLLGGLVTYMRLFYLHRVGMKFRHCDPDINSKRIHRCVCGRGRKREGSIYRQNK